VHDGGVEFARERRGVHAHVFEPAVKQRDAIARLQAQHLYVARGACGQVDVAANLQRERAVKTWHSFYNDSCWRLMYAP
jgi:hypothetical protein